MLARLLNQEGNTSAAIKMEAMSWLYNAIEALPEPWIALASTRHASADGPPWVRYIVLHPDKGIALVDTDNAEPAVAPLDDFLWHTGFAALQGDALRIVAVTVTAQTSGAVVDQISAAFGGSPCGLANPNWCEAVVDLLLATPNLMLMRLRPSVPAAVTAPAASRRDGAVHQPQRQVELSPPMEPSTPLREHWSSTPEAMPPPPTWYSWPISPVAAAMALLALGTVVLVARQASPPANEISHAQPVAVVASAAPPAATAPSPRATATIPPPAVAPDSAPPVDVAVAKIPPVRTPAAASPKKTAPYPTVPHEARRSAVPPTSSSRQVASANTTRSVCADVLHPDLPGGWQYRGPPVPQCLPIRFFGLIGMR